MLCAGSTHAPSCAHVCMGVVYIANDNVCADITDATKASGLPSPIVQQSHEPDLPQGEGKVKGLVHKTTALWGMVSHKGR